MLILKGHVVQGCGHFRERLTRPDFCAAYRKATGEGIWGGTLNVEVNKCIPVKEHFRIRGTEYVDPIPAPNQQDLLFEVCRVNGIWAYRIRPYDVCTGAGGHGDHILEIGCSREIPGVAIGAEIRIELLRDDIEPLAD
jgi:CTP-dependent riboflavin kinase